MTVNISPRHTLFPRMTLFPRKPRTTLARGGALMLALLLGGCEGSGANVSGSDAWIAATAPGQTRAAAYFTVVNDGSRRAILATVEAPGTATAASLHRSTLTGGVMRMQALDDGLAIEPGARATLRPMANHVMLTGLTRRLTVGETVPLMLRFDDASEVRLIATVRSAQAMAM